MSRRARKPAAKKAGKQVPGIGQRSRPPLERMMKIHQAISEGKHPNATILARQLEVSTKSIHRDIEFMRDRLGLPLEYHPSRLGYYYTEEVQSFPTMQISEGELFALMVAEKALQQYRGTPFETPLVTAFQKMANALPDTISLNLDDWSRAISFRTTAEPFVNSEVFSQLSRAVTHRRRLEILYKKPGTKQPEQRVIDPCHVANINGEWFVFAFDHLRKDIRTFSPARILSIQETGETFPATIKFSLEHRLKDSFGVHSADGNYRVVLVVESEISDYIREKKWHSSQEIAEQPDGTLELRMTLSSLVEVERWILGWGGRIKVIEPMKLKSRVLEAARKFLEGHGPDLSAASSSEV